MQPSASLIAFIKQKEGFAPRAYLDPPHNSRGLYSIGYGHQIQQNERALLTKVLTEPEASLMLNADLRYYVNSVNSSLRRPVTQQQFDALVDFAYNDGTGAEQKVVATWNTTGDSLQTVNHIKEYVYSGGAVNPDLVNRRQHEANWFQGIIAGVEKKSST